jgi:hypothetical protein
LPWAFLIACATAAFAQQLPGIALSPNTIYAPVTGGGVQAIDVRDGTVLWKNSRGRWPLAYGNGKLVALGPLSRGNNSSVVFLDAVTGKSLAEVGPVQFAPWAYVRFDYSKNSNAAFRIWTRWTNEGGAMLLWSAERWPPVDLRHLNKPQVQQRASGRVSIGFATNSVQSNWGPVAETPPIAKTDRTLPLPQGQKAMASAAISVEGTLALVAAGPNVNLMFFHDRVLQWSLPIATKRA